MKTIFRTLLVLTIVNLISLSAMAQATQQDANFKRRVAEKVRLMNDYISYMSSKNNSTKTRKFYSEKALNLFIGKGYEYKDDGITKEGVMMQTTSATRGTTTTTLLRKYFDRLINLHYTKVVITSTEAADMKVSDLKKIGKNLYVCTCQYVQYFCGYIGEDKVYSDKTTKRITCYIMEEDTEDGTEYMILLGDVQAISTERT